MLTKQPFASPYGRKVLLSVLLSLLLLLLWLGLASRDIRKLPLVLLITTTTTW